jgi:hypothetical protein
MTAPHARARTHLSPRWGLVLALALCAWLVVPVARASAAGFTGLPLTVTSTEGATYTGAIATFTLDNSDPLVDLSAVIDWGDGTTTPAASISQPLAPGSVFLVNGSHMYNAPGVYTITVSLTDSNGPINGTAITSMQVEPFGPIQLTSMPILANAETSFDGTVATFTQAGIPQTVGSYAASIDWGDGGPVPATVIAGQGGIWSVTGTHTYATAGPRLVTVSVSDLQGVRGSVQDLAQVADVTAPAVTVTGVPKRISRSALLKHGLAFVERVTEPVRWSDDLLGSATASRLQLAYDLTLAHVGTTSFRGRTRTVVLRPSRSLVGSAKHFHVEVRVVATDPSGNERTVTRVVSVRP